jgi:DNA (cytosine-5)-methyltransferase 1
MVNGRTYVDLFAGAGGLSIGLEKAGFELLHAVEVDESARKTFAGNREGWTPEDVTGDITEVPKSAIEEKVGHEKVDLVVGGPPCQGFSEVLSPDGSDERNHLFEYFVDWVDELDPTAALFENVRGMQKTAGGEFLDAVKTAFGELGYEVSDRVVSSSNFGVPQHRHRLFVLATKAGTMNEPFTGYDLNPVAIPNVMDTIGDLPSVGPGETKETYDNPPETVIQRDLRADSKKLSSHQAANHTDDLIERIKHVPDGGDKADIPEELQPSSGYHNSYSRLKSDEPAVAITSNMSKPSSARCTHPFQNRGLTPREGARLQTFPDTYRFEGTLGARRQQIGNAVPPYLAEAFGYYLKESVFQLGLDDQDKERITTLRCSGLTTDEFDGRSSEISGHAKQATLGNTN